MSKKKVGSILIVDDEAEILKALEIRLTSWGYGTDRARSGFGALEKIAMSRYDVVLLDIAMPLMDGVETFRRIRNMDKSLPVIFISAYDDIKLAETARKLTGTAFISKPFNDEEIREVLEKAIVSRGLPPPSIPLRSHIKERYKFANIIGKSEHIEKVFEAIDKVKDNDVTVLIYGESGTGKELVARAIHFNGIRMERPFISFSCAAIPETLLESELFGFEKGAFTDAKMRMEGKFEQAHRGALFLDEIGEMSLTLQAKILRVLEGKEFQRIGGKERIKVDTRIIVATNKDLHKEVLAGKFREDLYYRINIFPIYIPPLRKRREDIPLLVDHFIDKFNKKGVKVINRISDGALQLLLSCRWKGNVRELENALERAMILAEGDTIREVDFSSHLRGPKSEEEKIERDFIEKADIQQVRPLKEVERDAISRSLRLCNGKVTLAARKLGIGRNTFYRKAKKYGII